MGAIAFGADSLTLAASGGPLQYATNRKTSPWFNLSTNTADVNGRRTTLDPDAAEMQRYYRTVLP